jgi:hypothetical protein
MQEDLSKEDLVSAHIDRWVANQWLKVSKKYLQRKYLTADSIAFVQSESNELSRSKSPGVATVTRLFTFSG